MYADTPAVQAKLRRVAVGIGSNLGDPRANVERAIAALGELWPAPEPGETWAVRRASSLWRTVPVGGPPQADFCNAAVLAESTLPARRILKGLLSLESAFGRTRGPERNGPRTLDLDLLWIEEEIVHEEDLEVPHPRLSTRSFALVPLLEVAPDAADPITGRSYAELLGRLGGDGVKPWPVSR